MEETYLYRIIDKANLFYNSDERKRARTISKELRLSREAAEKAMSRRSRPKKLELENYSQLYSMNSKAGSTKITESGFDSKSFTQKLKSNHSNHEVIKVHNHGCKSVRERDRFDRTVCFHFKSIQEALNNKLREVKNSASQDQQKMKVPYDDIRKRIRLQLKSTQQKVKESPKNDIVIKQSNNVGHFLFKNHKLHRKGRRLGFREVSIEECNATTISSEICEKLREYYKINGFDIDLISKSLINLIKKKFGLESSLYSLLFDLKGQSIAYSKLFPKYFYGTLNLSDNLEKPFKLNKDKYREYQLFKEFLDSALMSSKLHQIERVSASSGAIISSIKTLKLERSQLLNPYTNAVPLESKISTLDSIKKIANKFVDRRDLMLNLKLEEFRSGREFDIAEKPRAINSRLRDSLSRMRAYISKIDSEPERKRRLLEQSLF